MRKLIFLLLLLPAVNNSQWIEQQTPFGDGIILSVDFVDLNTGVACGWYLQDTTPIGRAMYTTNGGINWFLSQFPDSSRSFVTVQFVNSTTAYIAGAYNIPGKNSVNRPLTGFNFSKNRSISYIWSGRPMFSTGTRGYFLKSTNSGQSWFPYGTIPQDAYYFDCMYFNNSLTGYVCTSVTPDFPSLEKIYETTNGGSSWFSSYSSNDTVELKDIYFTDLNTGFVVGDVLTSTGFQGLIMRTTNGGNIWTRQSFPTVNNFTAVKMINSTTGFISGVNNQSSGASGIIFKSTNSGVSWNQINYIVENCLLEGINFIPGTGLGICYGEKFDGITFLLDSSLISKSTDYGITWMEYTIKDDSTVNIGSKMINETHWYISGGSAINVSKLLYTTNGGNPIGIKPVSNEIPKSFSLSQNYPNPFNPSTKIKFNISLSRGVDAEGGRGVLTKLIVYDVLGREVATLVNEKLSPGTYEAEWDASSFPSGMYFYQLAARGKVIDSKKMVFMK
jgi:hypothetical protein